MSSPTLSTIQTRELSRNIITFLSLYKHISDSYIIEFFSEDLWQTLPTNWQQVLCDLSPPQISDLLLDGSNLHRSYPSVWPLSLMAFRATAHTLSFPRVPLSKTTKEVGTLKPEEFQENQCQSSLLPGHIFRKHVKPKKQHEIRRLGTLVKQICDMTGCMHVVDVGSGQGHLSRFLSFGLGISVTGIEADPTLVAMATTFDGQLLCTLEKEKKKNGSFQQFVPGPSPHHVTGWVNPKESWKAFIKQLAFGNCVAEDHIAASLKKSPWESSFVLEQKPFHGDQPVLADHFHTEQTTFSLEENDMMLKTSYATHKTTSQNAQESECQSMSSSPKRFCKMEAEKELCPNSYPHALPVYEKESPAGAVVCPGEDEPRHPDFVLTGLHSCGDLSATLLRHFSHCPHVRGITSVACCYMKITTKEKPAPPGLIDPPLSSTLTNEVTHCEFGYPMSSWLQGLPGHQLSYKSREGACHAVEDYMQRLKEESSLLKTHCYRAVLETVIRGAKPELRRAGIQTIKKSHQLSFHEYARLGLPRVGLPADMPLDSGKVEAMLKQQHRVVVYFSLALLLAPVVETLVLLDRMIFLQEQGIESQLVPLFDPVFSPRNLVLVAVKPKRDKGNIQKPF